VTRWDESVVTARLLSILAENGFFWDKKVVRLENIFPNSLSIFGKCGFARKQKNNGRKRLDFLKTGILFLRVARGSEFVYSMEVY
jgi:hypothetical protein